MVIIWRKLRLNMLMTLNCPLGSLMERSFWRTRKSVPLAIKRAWKSSPSRLIYKNKGSATAYDVSLTNDRWGHDKFDVTSGNTSKTWERLDGGAIVSHLVVLDSQAKGVFQSSHVVIKYHVPSKVALQEALSTSIPPLPPLDILAERPPEKKLEQAKRLLARYGSLVSVLTFVALFDHILASPSKSFKAAKKKL